MKRTLTLAGMMLGLLGTLFLAAPTEAQPPRYKLHGNYLVLAQPGDAGPLFVEERLGQFIPVPGGKAKADAPAAAGESKKLGPVACAVVRIHLTKEYQKQGLGRVAALRKAREADDETINGLVAEAEKVAQTKMAGAKFGQIGDGSFIQAIVDFFKSPAGQALIQALIELITHLLAVSTPAPPDLYLDQRDLIGQWYHVLAA